jgi:dTDP-4-dehydrorhamnose reductase
MLKVLVLGGSGLVGSTFFEYAKDSFDIHLTYNKNSLNFSHQDSTHLDLINQPKLLNELILQYAPDVVINTIAHSSVDHCEINHEDADLLHLTRVIDILKASEQIGSRVIHFSTDAVFPGELNKKYTENDMPNPINYYGKTKLKSEKLVLEFSSKNTVLRTSVVYGSHHRSRFTQWILPYLKNKKTVDPFIDQFNTPTLVNDLAKSLTQIIDKNIFGLFHASGSTCINRYDFALLLAKKFRYDSKLIKPVTSKEKKQIAPRPISTCLDSTKLETILGFKFSDLNSGISYLYKNNFIN